MRNLVLALAAAGSALAVATPVSAQYYPQSYGYGYGYDGGRHEFNVLERRIYNVLRSLAGVRPDQRYELRAEAIKLDRQLHYAARNGLNPYEAHEIDVRIGRLERRQQWASMSGWRGEERYNGYNGYYGDRQRYDGDHRWNQNGDDDGD